VELIDLKSLETFDVQRNKIADLSLGLIDMPSLKTGFLKGNPLRPPFDSMAKQDGNLTDILQFLRDVKKDRKEWKLVKLVVCGMEGVGKTHITRRLQNMEYEKNVSTDGIDVEVVPSVKGKNRELSFMIFDMGGTQLNQVDVNWNVYKGFY